jgi:hypothetical protein
MGKQVRKNLNKKWSCTLCAAKGSVLDKGEAHTRISESQIVAGKMVNGPGVFDSIDACVTLNHVLLKPPAVSSELGALALYASGYK